ncbi:MAG: AfsR/SARP family transcriptional regulator [Kineosporiaceae bacterium]
MQFHVLGTVRIMTEGGDLLAGCGPRPRSLAALLMVRAGRDVPADVLLDWLWGDRAPTSRNALHQHAYRLRRALKADAAATDRLHTSGGSYRLDVADAELDLTRFRALARQARRDLARARPESAISALRRAAALWTGPPLAGCAVDSLSASAHVQALTEERLGVHELLAATEVATGSGAAALADLTRLIARYPLRERLHGLLMTALARQGRRAEALAAYAAAAALLDEQGLRPGAELRAVHASVLADAVPDQRRIPAHATHGARVVRPARRSIARRPPARQPAVRG